MEVRALRTVVRLTDARDRSHESDIATTFVPTPEAARVVAAVYGRMARRQGEGFFLQGAYGSGKSHLLAYLDVTVREGGARALDAGERDLEAAFAGVPAASWLAVSIALVDHPSRSSLESIVTAAIAGELTACGATAPPQPEGDRRVWASAVAQALASVDRAGLLLLVDELSEFLRAKPDARSFAEDIRFLQFLGERASDLPAVVVATLQESLDETGPIAPEAFAKIKDRYPNRFLLTADHVGQLVRRRILTARPGARGAVDAIHRHLRSCLPHWDVDADTFRGLYPVHPATLVFLEQLRGLFSQNRGVVDFLVARLVGSPDRGIAPHLDQPAGTLLTADVIWDHFSTRVRERIETAPLADEVMAWWEENLASLWPRPDEARLARRALKVLALASLFPFDKWITVRQMARTLTVSVTELEPSLNDHTVADVLERMVARGAYVVRQPVENRDPLDAAYQMRRGADAALVLRARVREIAAELSGRPDEVARAALAVVDSSPLPLARLAAEPRSRRTVAWQGTLRDGWVAVADPTLLTPEQRDDLAREVATAETDFLVFVVPPWVVDPAAGAPDRPAATADLADLPLIRWTPRPLEDLEFVREARARQILARKLAGDAAPRSRELVRALEPALEDDRRRLSELVSHAYAAGAVEGPSGALPFDGASVPLAFERWLERVAGAVLEQRYPRHFSASPAGVNLSRQRLSELIETFLRPGQCAGGHALPATVKPIVESYMKSLGLAGRHGPLWQLRPDPARSEIVRLFVEAVGDEPAGVEELYWRLRKGPFGLTRATFELVLASLVFSGHLVPLSLSRRMPLGRVNAGALERITQVQRERPLPEEVVADLAGLPFVFAKGPAPSAGPALTKQLWDEILALKSRSILGLGGLAARLQHAQAEMYLAHLGLEEAAPNLDAFMRVVAAVRSDSTPRDGLVELHRALEGEGLTKSLAGLRPLIRFVEEDATRFMEMAAYLSQEELDIPTDPRYGPLSVQLAALRDRARRRETCLDREALAGFLRDFEAFQQAYQSAYVADHQARRSSDAIAPYARLASSREMSLIATLSRSPFAVPPAIHERLRSSLDAAVKYVCTRLTPFMLKTRAACTCGHRLGEEMPVPPASDLAAWRDQALREVLDGLGSREHREELRAAGAQAREWGHDQDASLLEDLAALDRYAPDLAERIARLAAAPVEAALTRLAAGRAAPVRDVGDLAGRLAGRMLSVSQVMAAVQTWLGGELTPASRVRIVDARRAPVVAGLDEILARSAATRAQSAAHGPAVTLAMAVVLYWAQRHELPYEAAVRAAGLPLPGGADPGALAAAGAEVLSAGPAGAVTELLARTCNGAVETALMDLIGGRGGPAEIARALARECAFPTLARRLAMQSMRALAAGVSLPPWPPEREPAAVPQHPGVRAHRDLVRAAVQLSSRVEALANRRGHWPASCPEWEERFGELADLPLAASRLDEAAVRLSLGAELAETGIAGALTRMHEAATAAFSTAYHELARGVWEKEGAGVLWPHRVVTPLLARHRLEHRAPATILIVVDAMRMDLAAMVQSEFLALPRVGLSLIEQRTVWSLAPTVTAVNMRALLGGVAPGVADLLPDSAADEPPAASSTVTGIEPPPGVQLETITVIDEHVHGSTLTLAQLADAVVPVVTARLAVIVEKAPRGALLAITADHGFTEAPGWRPHAGLRRWRHGGLDPFEVLVPLAVYRKL